MNKIYSSELSYDTTDNNRQISSEVKPAKNSRNFDCKSCENTEKAYRTADRMQNSGRNTLPDYNATALCTLKSGTGFFDSHCHLDFLFNRENIRNIWQKHLSQNNVWAAFGCHPHEAANYNDEVEEALKLALNHPKGQSSGRNRSGLLGQKQLPQRCPTGCAEKTAQNCTRQKNEIGYSLSRCTRRLLKHPKRISSQIPDISPPLLH
ncbi:deoxyribonuclease TATDN2 [Caerostris extrusa]|uniref:Deoxyribonuclease TATDN2 n=1 Tax=Caerostris extrusa TaxID=172846 RepID=A0AAV4MA64_CAEEX|nr:deoxyribonuclease TATDN2 [Caerostris extrusa]